MMMEGGPQEHMRACASITLRSCAGFSAYHHNPRANQPFPNIQIFKASFPSLTSSPPSNCPSPSHTGFLFTGLYFATHPFRSPPSSHPSGPFSSSNKATRNPHQITDRERQTCRKGLLSGSVRDISIALRERNHDSNKVTFGFWPIKTRSHGVQHTGVFESTYNNGGAAGKEQSNSSLEPSRTTAEAVDVPTTEEEGL